MLSARLRTYGVRLSYLSCVVSGNFMKLLQIQKGYLSGNHVGHSIAKGSKRSFLNLYPFALARSSWKLCSKLQRSRPCICSVDPGIQHRKDILVHSGLRSRVFYHTFLGETLISCCLRFCDVNASDTMDKAYIDVTAPFEDVGTRVQQYAEQAL